MASGTVEMRSLYWRVGSSGLVSGKFVNFEKFINFPGLKLKFASKSKVDVVGFV